MMVLPLAYAEFVSSKMVRFCVRTVCLPPLLDDDFNPRLRDPKFGCFPGFLNINRSAVQNLYHNCNLSEVLFFSKSFTTFSASLYYKLYGCRLSASSQELINFNKAQRRKFNRRIYSSVRQIKCACSCTSSS